MALLFTTNRNLKIRAFAVPQSWASPTGPTWVYLLENDGLTMIDSGGAGSYSALVEGLRRMGLHAKDVERVILTHGHWDHDGGAPVLVEEGSHLWAHEIYSHLAPYHPKELINGSNSATQDQLSHVLLDDTLKGSQPSLYSQQKEHSDLFDKYLALKRDLSLNRTVNHDEQIGDLRFVHTPGHSPDHVCISTDDILFTGDHVLPEISPHPTMKPRYPDYIREQLSQEYQDESNHWGLLVYLKSLKRVQTSFDEDVLVLPAHRLFNKGKLNLVTVQRAGEIVEHHVKRLTTIIRWLGPEARTLEDITRNVFSRRKLVGGNLFPAFREIVSHLELLVDSGDVEHVDGKTFRWKGTENFRHVIRELEP